MNRSTSAAVMERRGLSRRQFVTGMAAAGTAASIGLLRGQAFAGPAARLPASVLSGAEMGLHIGETRVNITGRERTALTINGSLPGPTLRWREGDIVTIHVTNGLDEVTSLHWHGILLPANMDGVPGLSFNGIPPRGAFTYQFRVRQSGTYWYHSHSGFQEQQGVYAPLIIDPAGEESLSYDREHVVMLTDWTDEDPARVFAKLKKQSDYYNLRQRTVGDFIRDVRRHGFGATVAERAAWGRMRMSASDLADVTGATYTYLMNGMPPAANWTGLFAPGERIRLRFINGSAMTYFDVRIPGMGMTVVAADGLPVRPVAVDEFRIAVAETLDVIVEPPDEEAFTIFAQAMDRTGYAAGTLAVAEGLRAPVPEPDPRPVLSMDDMGHGDHGGHAPAGGARPADDHGAHGTGGGAAGSAGGQGVHDTGGHGAHGTGGHGAHASGGQGAHASGGQGAHGRHGHGPAAVPDDPHAGHGVAPPPGQPAHDGHDTGHGGVEVLQTHPASEAGNPLVDMQVMAPTSRLEDPGIGLRNNGRRVLTYSDLRSAFPDPDGRPPGRTIELHLTGHMERFVWSFDGIRFIDAVPVRLTYGERVRLVLVNDTMMAHPIHLHGMWSDLEDDEGQFLVRKHTIDMPPGTRRTLRITADALGRWAFHCHLLFHMEAGMFREVRVEEGGAS